MTITVTTGLRTCHLADSCIRHRKRRGIGTRKKDHSRANTTKLRHVSSHNGQGDAVSTSGTSSPDRRKRGKRDALQRNSQRCAPNEVLDLEQHQAAATADELIRIALVEVATSSPDVMKKSAVPPYDFGQIDSGLV